MRALNLSQPVALKVRDDCTGAAVTMLALEALQLAAQMLAAQQRNNQADFRSLAALAYLEAVLSAACDD